MKQIIMLHIGQCGVQMANSCWQLFCNEHGISESGRNINQSYIGNPHALFSQASSGKITPRAIHIDLQPSVIDQIKHNKYKKLYNPSQMIAGKEDAANNYIRGHYTIGKQISDQAQDMIRKQVQKTDYLQGIIMTHSINGGTGSGLGGLLMERMAVNLPKKDKINLLVYPSKNLSDTVVEPYNAVLSGHDLLQHSSLTIPIANQCMYSIVEQQLDVQKPTYANINYLAALTASNLTVGSRFSGQNSWSIRDLLVNLVPYPRIHFAASSFNQFSSTSYAKYEKKSIRDVTNQVFHSKNYCIDIGTFNPKFISSFLMFRSQNPIYSEVVRQANLIRQSTTLKFVDWLPTNLKLGASSQPIQVLKYNGCYETTQLSCNMLSINNRIDHIFARVNHKFDIMYAKRAFVHWYVGEGLDEGFFSQARQDLAALEKDFEDGSDFEFEGEYQQYQDQQPQ